MVESARREETFLESRRQATLSARSVLDDYKRSLTGKVGDDMGLINGLSAVSSELTPAVNAAYQQTQPLRQMFRDLDQPIPAGEAMGLMGGLFGQRRSSGPVTALSLATNLDPNVGLTITALKAMCDGIDGVHNEVGMIATSVDPTVEAARAFARSTRRADMLLLVKESPNAAGYCASKSTWFDPVLGRIEEARGRLGGLYTVANRLSLPPAREAIYSIASGADRLIGTSAQPFQQAKQALMRSGEDLRAIDEMERTYLSAIARLKGDGAGSGPSAGGSSSAASEFEFDRIPMVPAMRLPPGLLAKALEAHEDVRSDVASSTEGAAVDLDSDGTPEWILFLPALSGSGGSAYELYAVGRPSGWRKIGDHFGSIQRIGPSRSRGFLDIEVLVNAPESEQVMRWNGNQYETHVRAVKASGVRSLAPPSALTVESTLT
jgi:hypothetical protein